MWPPFRLNLKDKKLKELQCTNNYENVNNHAEQDNRKKSSERQETANNNTNQKVYIVIIGLALAAVKTVIPFPYVSKACMLGYKAGCSFTPISTIILVVAIAITYVVAKRKKML